MSVARPVVDLSALGPLPEFPAQQIYLHPGHLVFTTQPALITTILGPCVSVCLFDDDSGTAGVNHYLVPMKLGSESPRSAEIANELLLSKFREAGISTAALKAKVFGGATIRSARSDLAERNVNAAFEFLQRAGIRIVGTDVGGPRGRKLLFRSSDGAAWVRFL